MPTFVQVFLISALCAFLAYQIFSLCKCIRAKRNKDSENGNENEKQEK